MADKTPENAPWRNRIVDQLDMPIAELNENLMNWRKHPRSQASALTGVIEEVGVVQTVILNRRSTAAGWPEDTEPALVDGHLRLDLARKQGETTLPVTVVDLSEDEERMVLATFDPVGELARSNDDVLQKFLPQIDTQRRGVKALLDEMYKGIKGKTEPGPAPEPKVDQAEQLRDKWGTERGQLWRIGEHRLMCGDSTCVEDVKRLLAGEKLKYGLHDPPYGISVVGGASAIGGSKPFGSIGADGEVPVNRYHPVEGDDKPFDPRPLLPLTEFVVIWGGNYFADKLPISKAWICWDKKNRDGWRDTFSDCELAWSNLPMVTRMIRYTWIGMVQEGKREERAHPTQKPVEMLVKLIQACFIDEGSILDLYAGAGGVLIAAEREGRTCYAMEKAPQFVAVALQRLSDMGLKPALDASGE